MNWFKISGLARTVSKLALVFCISVSFAMTPTSVIYAQHGGSDGADSAESDDISSSGVIGKNRVVSRVKRKNTKQVIREIDQANTSCIIVPVEYRADCIAQAFKEAGVAITKPAYQPVRDGLLEASLQIDEVVASNLDEAAPELKVGDKTYHAVKKEAVETVNQQVAAVITETSTKLIRSAGKSITRKIHFQRIAKAVDSTKVLLRSA